MNISVGVDYSDNCNNIRILAVGDIMLGISSLRAIAEKNTIPMVINKDPYYIIEKIIPYIEHKDILFGNLECTISQNFDYDNFDNPQLLMAPEKAIKLLKCANFDVINLANNHILDHGDNVLMTTVKLLEEENFKIIGAPNTKYEQFVNILHVKNKKIGFCGYNLCDEGKKSGISEILDIIGKYKNSVDIFILSLHWGWGFEHSPVPSPRQIELGRMFIDAGVDVILGHHSHVFQPIELYKNKVIAYSLGNFIFDMWRRENKESAILEITIDPKNDIFVSLIPIKQENYILNYNSVGYDRFQSLVIKQIETPLDKQYFDEATKIRKRHRKEIIQYYLINFYKFSLKFNFCTISRWFSKIAKQ